MSLNLALVINGDASGAKRAVEETTKAVHGLGTEASTSSSAIVAANNDAARSAERVTAATLSQSAAQQRAKDSVVQDNAAIAGAVRLTSNQMLNLSRQGNDVATMWLMGASAGQIFASQAGQIYGVLEEGPGGLRGSLNAVANATKSAGQAFMSFMMTGPGIIAGVGVAAVAGLASYIIATREDLRDLDDVLKDHRDVVKSIGDEYGIVQQKAKGAFSYNTPNSFGLRAAANSNELELGLRAAVQNSFGDLLTNRGGGGSGNQFGPAQIVASEFSEFADAIDHLRITARQGTPDVLGFKEMVEARWALDRNNSALAQTAQRLLELTANSVDAARALKELEAIRKQMEAAKGPGGIPLRRGALSTEDMGGYEQMQAAARVSAERAQQEFDAQTQRLLARSPGEVAAAARAGAAATYNESETPTMRAQRIELAGKRALIDAEHELTEAQRQRLRSLDETIASAKLDVQLVGQNASETARLRMEYELTAQVRAAAADAGVEADEAELALIKQKAAEYGRLQAAQQAAEAIRSQTDDLANLKLEALLVGQNEAVRDRAIAQMQTEQDIRRLGIDLYGEQAEMMRRNTSLSSDLTEELAKQSDAWKAISDTASSGIDRLVDSAANGFKDIGDALGDIGKDLLKTSLQLTVGNPLKNWLTGSDLPEMGDLKSMGGALGRLFGMSPQDPASAVSSVLGGQSTAMMNVSAGVVNINGTGAGGSSGLLGQLLGGAANDNGLNDNYAPGAVTRAPLGPVSDMAGYIQQAAIARNIDPNIALKVAQSEGLAAGVWQSNLFKNGVREPSFGPFQLLKGGAGTGFPTGLGNDFLKQTGLDPANPANARAGVDFALDHASQNGWGAWYGAKAAGVGNFEGIGASSSKAVTALDKLGATTVAANQNMTGFGNGLNQLSNTLNQFPAAPSGGGGGFLSSFFNGPGNASLSPAAWSAIQAGGGGLYEYGGYTGDGPKDKPAGVVHAGEIVWSQDDINRAGGVHVVEAMRLGRRGYAEGGYVVDEGGGRAFAARASYAGAAGGGTEVNIYPQAGTEAKTRKRKNASGGDVTDIIVGVVKQSIADGDLDGSFGGRFGAKPVRARRGAL